MAEGSGRSRRRSYTTTNDLLNGADDAIGTSGTRAGRTFLRPVGAVRGNTRSRQSRAVAVLLERTSHESQVSESARACYCRCGRRYRYAAAQTGSSGAGTSSGNAQNIAATANRTDDSGGKWGWLGLLGLAGLGGLIGRKREIRGVGTGTTTSSRV
jgi:MYXO-CTERM domain-containing protein